MSGWIKWEKDLETDPRFIRLVRHVRDTCVTGALQPDTATTLTVGALLRFWSYADTHIRMDDTLDLGLIDIDDLVALSGFAAGLPEDWLVEIDNKTVELPGYQEHNGVEAKKRDLARKRQENKRRRDGRFGRDASVTGALLDQTRPDQTKTKKNTSAASRPAKKTPPTSEPDWLIDMKAIYPKRAGDQDWPRALRNGKKRIKSGHTANEMLDGARRYADYVRATGSEGTQFVKQAASFIGSGDSKPFLDTWDSPRTKADNRTRTNLTAAATAKQQLIAEGKL